jgi:DNA-binding NtrC family response regulator
MAKKTFELSESLYQGLIDKIQFLPEEGKIWLSDQRMILLHTGTLGALRKELIEALGMQGARRVLTRMGYVSGTRDACLASKLSPDSSEMDLFSAGPLLHKLEGVVCAKPVKIDFDLEKGNYYGEFIWENSYECDVHKNEFGLADEAVCWSELGYACGHTSSFMGKFILYKEVECRGKGDACCRIIGKPIEDWGEEEAGAEYFEAESVYEEIAKLESQVRELSMENELDSPLVGNSKSFKKPLALLKLAAQGPVTVLFTGETGVGKELFAKELHNLSERSDKPFVAFNCAAVPDDLLESELFGVLKGAFTGATNSRPGRFERADGGTLFLDEVGELSAQAQAKLLRVLQEGELERVGDVKTRKVDVRIIAATNRKLRDEVKAKTFREDLYFRLNIFPIEIPALRDRGDDVQLLAELFLEKSNVKHCKKVLGITDRARDALLKYEWPGNIRELENLIERGVILTPSGRRIDRDILFATTEHEDDFSDVMGIDTSSGNYLQNIKNISNSFFDAFINSHTTLVEFEWAVMDKTVKRASGNLSEAARLLGMTRPQLAYRMEKMKSSKGEE